jgi:hypothetical protein
VYTGSSSTFQSNMLSLASRLRSKPSFPSRLLLEELVTRHILKTLKIEAVRFYETSVYFYNTTRHYVVEDGTLHITRNLMVS